MGFPASNTSGFPGKRVEPYLAGMTTTTLAKLSSFHSPRTRNKNCQRIVYDSQRRLLVRRCYHTPTASSGRSNCSIVNIKQLHLCSKIGVVESGLVRTA